MLWFQKKSLCLSCKKDLHLAILSSCTTLMNHSLLSHICYVKRRWLDCNHHTRDNKLNSTQPNGLVMFLFFPPSAFLFRIVHIHQKTKKIQHVSNDLSIYIDASSKISYFDGSRLGLATAQRKTA